MSRPDLMMMRLRDRLMGRLRERIKVGGMLPQSVKDAPLSGGEDERPADFSKSKLVLFKHNTNLGISRMHSEDTRWSFYLCAVTEFPMFMSHAAV
ncbi:hypothetical protein SUGI_1027660 [Cryptomeria japonica]|nr:hypothetical protein SUGI_1027660 [Cryptomeria japonica]